MWKKKAAGKFERDKLFSAAELKYQGWTEAAINNYAGTPDDSRENPMQKSGPPMRFWLKTRITRIKQTKRFLAWQEGASARKAAASAGVRTRIDKMEKAIESAEITIVPGWSEERLKVLSLKTHGGNYEGKPRGEWHWDNRTARNTIRHNLTNYEALWGLINRGDTSIPAYELLRERVDALIDKTYPQYREDYDERTPVRC